MFKLAISQLLFYGEKGGNRPAKKEKLKHSIFMLEVYNGKMVHKMEILP